MVQSLPIAIVHNANGNTWVKKVYRKWSDSEKEMTLHMAVGNMSDPLAASFLFPL